MNTSTLNGTVGTAPASVKATPKAKVASAPKAPEPTVDSTPKPSKADARALLTLYVAASSAIAMLDKAYRAAKGAGRTAPVSLSGLADIVSTRNQHRAAIEAVPLSVTAPGGLNRADVWSALFGTESTASIRKRCDAAAELYYGLTK